MDRQPFYLSDESGSLFCCVHNVPQDLQPKDCTVVICNPLGYEYILSHRSVRHLADHLAGNGYRTIRFDYSGAGDSSGDDLDPHRLETWKQNIKRVAAHAKIMSGCASVCLIGIRMGATLSALIASDNETKITQLVLWNPYIQGRHYVREMKALALAPNALSDKGTNHIESIGFILSAETMEEITKINIQDIDFPNETQVLLIDRDDRIQYHNLSDQWTNRGIHLDYLVQSGHSEMFAEPHDTVVPTHTLHKISEWLTKNRPAETIPCPEPSLIKVEEQAVMQTVSERVCRFGSQGQLFGILTTPLQKPDSVMPTIVLLNAGSIHHVGPQRLYVLLARRLAAQGFPCFRIDFEGIGDSDLENVREENNPYQESAVQDVESALCFLSEQSHSSEFVLTGICSGAYTAFRSGLEIKQYKIVDTIPINPLVFHWEYGVSTLLKTTEETQLIRRLSRYKQSVNDSKQWIKLLRGEIPLGTAVKGVSARIQVLVKSYYKELVENFHSPLESRLSDDINGYLQMNRHLSFFLSTTDPGLDMITFHAEKVFERGMQENKIGLQMFDDTDHTFSFTEKRDELISRLGQHLIALKKKLPLLT